MFKNSGKKIMGFVKFVYVLNFIVALLALAGGIFYVINEFSYSTSTMVIAIVGCVLAAVVYMLLVFVSLLSLYAFGELAQSNLEIQRILTEMQSNTARVVPQPYRTPVKAAPRREEPRPAAPAPVQQPVFEEPAAPVAPAQPQSAPNFAYDYKAAAGAPVFPVPNSAPVNPEPAAPEAAPEVLVCGKCGAKHAPTANNCRYCGNALR